MLALLSAAYGKAVARAVLGNIARAGDAWRRGDDCLAYIHLAHSRLPELQEPYEAARRLFLAERFLEVGGNPRAVLEALNLDTAHIEAIEKVFNPAEPRVPAGSGRTSSQWDARAFRARRPFGRSRGATGKLCAASSGRKLE